MSLRWGFGFGRGAAVLMYGRFARLTMENADESRAHLHRLADWVDSVAEAKDMGVGVGVERFPDPEIFRDDSVDVTVAIGLRLNAVPEDRGMVAVGGMLDAHRKRAKALGAEFWDEASERLGEPLGTIPKRSGIDSGDPLRPKDELLLVHASVGLGCRYAIGVRTEGAPDLSSAPWSIQGMRRAHEAGIAGYHLWVEGTRQLAVRDRHRKRMADAVREHGDVMAWLGSVSA